MAKQGGFGAVEGAVDYTANYIADKIFRDPNAKFDWRELVSSMGMEGLSEALLAGIGAAGSRVNTDTNSRSGSVEGLPAVRKTTPK